MPADAPADAGRRAPTITDIAEAAHVSKSTVSLVLQGSPLIKAETAARVREVADALGYVYNRGAADLRRRASNVIGTVINDLTNPFFAELLVGLERRLADAGYVTLMAHTGEDLPTQERVLASMREYQAAGLILCPAFGTSASLLQQIRAWRIPVLIVVRPVGDESFDYAGSDNEAGTFAATKHLAERGHRRIAFLGRVGGGPVYELRRQGFARAMREHGLTIQDEWLIDIPPTREGGRAGIRQALSLRTRPTGAICYNDIVAFGALSELGERGMRAGRDFSVVGFDGIADGAHSNPPLTTISVDPAHLGESAAQLLLTRLREPSGPPLRYLAQPQLIVRQSSGWAEGTHATTGAEDAS
jgi:LacI family transcriptional regulator, galactose operon repressor